MSAIKLSTPSSGSISLSPADTASNLILTVPAQAGTVAVKEIPAFSAYLGGSLSVSNATLTKYTATVERFDTNSCYDAANARFTPNVAGYYLISMANWFSSGTGNTAGVIQKNGSTIAQEYDYMSGGTTSRVSCFVYMNGTTDYVEAYVYQFTGGTISLDPNSINFGFNGYLVRAA